MDRDLTLRPAQKPDDLVAIARGNASPEIRTKAVQLAIAGDSTLGWGCRDTRASVGLVNLSKAFLTVGESKTGFGKTVLDLVRSS